MWQWLLKTLIKEVIQAVGKAVSDYMKLKAKEKQDKETVKNALKEKDPKQRAKNISNLLNS